MISPVKEKTGEVAGSPLVARDITSHKQGEAVSRLSEKRVLLALPVYRSGPGTDGRNPSAAIPRSNRLALSLRLVARIAGNIPVVAPRFGRTES